MSSYFVDKAFVIEHLCEFLSVARKLGFPFAAVTTSEGRHPRTIIDDVSNTMTWERVGDVILFFRAGIQWCTIGGSEPNVRTIVSTVICPEEHVTAFHLDKNMNLHIQHAALVEEWKNLKLSKDKK